MDDSSNISNEHNLERSFLTLMRKHKRRSLLNMDSDKVKFEKMTIDESKKILETIIGEKDTENKLNKDFADLIKAHYRFMLLETDKKKPIFQEMNHDEALNDLESLKENKNNNKRWGNNIWYYSAAAIILIALASFFIIKNTIKEKDLNNKEQFAEKQSKRVSKETPSKQSVENNVHSDEKEETKESQKTIKNSTEIMLPKFYLKEPEVFGFVPPGKDTVFIDEDFVFNMIKKELDNFEFKRMEDKLISSEMYSFEGGEKSGYYVEIIHLRNNRYMIQTIYTDSSIFKEQKQIVINISNKIKELIDDMEE